MTSYDDKFSKLTTNHPITDILTVNHKQDVLNRQNNKVCDKLYPMTETIFPQPEKFSCDVFPLIGGYFYTELLNDIDSSKFKIRAVQYEWKWNIHERNSRVQRLGATISRARTRNIEVQIILHEESPGRNLSKINSVSLDALTRLGCSVHSKRTVGILHTKLWIIDNNIVYIGSHNISGRSLGVNEEVTLKSISPDIAKFMNRYFDNLWG